MIDIHQDVDLKSFSTMRLGGKAKASVIVASKAELTEAINWAGDHQLPFLISGGGSNTIFDGDYPGLIIVNHIDGYEATESDDGSTLVKVGAGENWDKIVARTVQDGLHGIECMSAIPGLAGGAPVQNAGAYGQEIADTLVELEAYDWQRHEFVTLNNADCQFSYRNSIFKSTTGRHYAIASITLKLSRAKPQPPFYARLQAYLDDKHITDYTPQVLRDAVIELRRNILPDPAKIANCGSFFKNPLIDEAKLQELLAENPKMPHWATGDGKVKISAGWLLNEAGLKGYSTHGLELYDNNILVIVNRGAKNVGDLLAFRQEITDKIRQKFGIQLEQEPELF